MRKIDQIIIHCSATPPQMDIGTEEIREWHKERGFNDVGYHYIIKRGGELQKGRSIDVQGAHARGHNKNSIGVCLIGGLDKDMKPNDNYTIMQKRKLRTLVNVLVVTFPGSEVVGHRDIPGVSKDCPCFDVIEWY